MSVRASKRCRKLSCRCVELLQTSLLACHMLSLLNTAECYQKHIFWMFFILSAGPSFKGIVASRTTTSLGRPTHAFWFRPPNFTWDIKINRSCLSFEQTGLVAKSLETFKGTSTDSTHQNLFTDLWECWKKNPCRWNCLEMWFICSFRLQ